MYTGYSSTIFTAILWPYSTIACWRFYWESLFHHRNGTKVDRSFGFGAETDNNRCFGWVSFSVQRHKLVSVTAENASGFGAYWPKFGTYQTRPTLGLPNMLFAARKTATEEHLNVRDCRHSNSWLARLVVAVQTSVTSGTKIQTAWLTEDNDIT